MRKTSYALTLLAVVATFTLNILSIQRPDWLYAHPPDIFRTQTTIRYGLLERCERLVFSLPNPGSDGRFDYTEYTCRPFPSRTKDGCERDNRTFCTLWWSAGYLAEVGAFFGAAAMVGLLIGVSTRSRRRRVWRGVAGLVGLHAGFQIAAFAIITNLYSTSSYPYFDYARPSIAYILNTVSWVVGILTMLGVVITGLSADAGHGWAAGNRVYREIPSEPPHA